MKKTLTMIMLAAAVLMMISCNGMITPSPSGAENLFSGRWTTGIVIQEENSLIPSVYCHGEKTDLEFLEDGQLEITVTHWIRMKHQTDDDWVADSGKKTVKETFVKQIRYENSSEWHIDLYEPSALSPSERMIWKTGDEDVRIISNVRGEMIIRKQTV